MDKELNYMTIPELTKDLERFSSLLEKGELHLRDIDEMTGLSRELFERLVVLRHKALESEVKLAQEASAVESAVQVESKPAPEVKEIEEIAEPEPQAEESNELMEERQMFRIGDTAVGHNQISLIDSIEEIKRMEGSLNDNYKEDSPSTLAHKLNRKPIANLKSAISINQKFNFIKNLFQEDKAAFETAVEKLNSSRSFLEADDYIQNHLKNRYDWEMKSPSVKELIDLVERRFL